MIGSYLLRLLRVALFVTPVFLLVRSLLFCFHLKKRQTEVNLLHEIGFWLLAVFCVGLLSLTVSTQWEFYTTEIQLRGEINLIPFDTMRHMLEPSQFNIVNVLGNILMFLPLGFLIPLLWRQRRPLKTVVLCAFGSSLCIELLQLFSWRSTDIDDLILNTLGGLLGGLLYLLLKKLLPNFVNRFKIKNSILQRAVGTNT